MSSGVWKRFVALALLAAWVPSLSSAAQQSSPPASSEPSKAAAAPTIPEYSDSDKGLEQLMNDIQAAQKSGDQKLLNAYLNSLVIQDPEKWFDKIFGSDLGPQYAAWYERRKAVFPAALAEAFTQLTEGQPQLKVTHFESVCDSNVLTVEMPLIAVMRHRVRLYDYRRAIQDNKIRAMWAFAYLDGGFRYLGPLRVPPNAEETNAAPQTANSALGFSADESDGTKPIHVEAKVQAAKLVRQVMPVYPPRARDERIQGDVVLHAIIAKDGNIKNLSVISGPCQLISPALDAVRHWKYSPTLLMNQPIEVDTTITVKFTLSR